MQSTLSETQADETPTTGGLTSIDELEGNRSRENHVALGASTTATTAGATDRALDNENE